MAIVSQAATEMAEGAAPGGPSATGAGAGAGAAWQMRGPQAFRRGTKTVEDVVAELRRIFPTPPKGLPDSVDIIREARDSL